MVEKNLNIPATLTRTIKGKQYKMDGMILAINESTDTCTMRFNNIIKDDVPIGSVLINEGIIDKIKEYSQKAVSYIRSKIKGFFVLIDEATKKILPGSEHNAANIAICSARNMFRGTWFSPAPALVDEAGISGALSIDQAFAPIINRETRTYVVPFWKRVIKDYGSTNKTLEESINYVKSHYYKSVTNKYNKSNELNEKVIYSIDDIPMTKDGYGEYGIPMGTTELKSEIMSNIDNQLTSGIGKKSNVPAILIWGAPGIGKTAILKGVAEDFRNDPDYDYNLHVQTIQCDGYTIENWTLPTDNSVSFEESDIRLNRFTDTPKTWLPVYEYTPDKEKLQKIDKFFNDCKFLGTGSDERFGSKDGKALNGGIVFFDEFARTPANVQRIMFNLASDRSFGDNFIVASRWGFVFAANRAIDDYDPESEAEEYFQPAAKANRFYQVLFVPTKEEWIEWAETINETTGLANIEPFIIEFIKNSPEYVWYTTIVNGGYDFLLDNPNTDKEAHKGDDPASDIGAVLDQRRIFGTKHLVTPRHWDRLSSMYRKELLNIFKGNNRKLEPEELMRELIEQSKRKVKASQEGVPSGFEVDSATEYHGGIKQDVLINALNHYVPADRWDRWVKKNGGYKRLNPGEVQGKAMRFNMLMTWFIEKVRKYTEDNSGDSYLTAKSQLMQQWRSYQSYEKVFDDSVCASIWNTGKMTKEYQKDDDKIPDGRQFESTQYSKWKSTITIAENVFNKVFDNFPDDWEDIINNDIAKMKIDNFAGKSDADVKKVAKQYRNQYSFELYGKQVDNLLITDDDMNNVPLLKTMLNTMINSKTAQYLCNFCIWTAKITLQTGTGQFAQIVADLLDNFFKTGVNLQAWNILTDAKQARITNQQQTKDPDNEEVVNANNIQLCKNPYMIARSVLVNAQEKESDETMNLYNEDEGEDDAEN